MSKHDCDCDNKHDYYYIHHNSDEDLDFSVPGRKIGIGSIIYFAIALCCWIATDFSLMTIAAFLLPYWYIKSIFS